MRREILPEFEFVLTPADQHRAAVARDDIEANRRRRNEQDRQLQREADARALARALELAE